MNIRDLILEIRTFLTNTFESVDHWFDAPAAMRSYKPEDGGWSVDEILEHIGLTNHYLLILIEKGSRKALLEAQRRDLSEALNGYEFHRERLTEVGMHQSFEWIRPEHMEPRGRPQDQVRRQLKDQVWQCLGFLDRMPNGEGVLYKTTMTVHALGKIDVYEYIYFLAQHGLRHIAQMKKTAIEYEQHTKR